MKKVYILFIIVVISTVFSVCYFMNNHVLVYEENRLTSNIVNDKIKNEIYQYISVFDKNIIESLQIVDYTESTLGEEQMIDIIIKYIISHKEAYQEKIIQFDENYSIEVDATIYYSNLYISEETFSFISKELFKKEGLNIRGSFYFDKNKNLIALLPIYGDVCPYNHTKILDFEELTYNEYSLVIGYYMNEECFFTIDYYVKRDNFNDLGKYTLTEILVNVI